MAATTTCTPTRFAVIPVGNPGARTYFYGNGSIVELATSGVPSNPASYNTWRVGANLTQFNIVNVTPFTDITAIGYFSPATQQVTARLFYQTTDGFIRTAYHSGLPGDPLWSVDPATIATVPLGSPLYAFQSNLNGGLPEVIVMQYTDVDGLLTQRFTTTEAINGVWSAPGKKDYSTVEPGEAWKMRARSGKYRVIHVMADAGNTRSTRISPFAGLVCLRSTANIQGTFNGVLFSFFYTYSQRYGRS
ncbi:hypothetical protein B0H13DRAFT_1924812 [Mycena leptocephala]|nr:hypothetical protein B0H13DRAFT_1924812 [Mycena leptocephala]